MMAVSNQYRLSRAVAGVSVLAGTLLLFACALPLTDGGGSRGGNPVVTGMIVNPDGSGASHTLVQLFPQSYDPVKDKILPGSFTDTTDENGSFSVRGSGPGIYNIQAIHLVKRTRLLMREIPVEGDTSAGTDTLRRPGAILVSIFNGFDVESGYVYIPGTNIADSLSGKAEYLILDSVPAGTALAVDYAAKNSAAAPRVIGDSVFVPQNGTVMLSYTGWNFQRSFYLNTSPSGANVSGDVYGFPVLVRLTASRFNFSQAAGNGEDIRFTKANGSPLSYEIERWDSSNGRAEIWVKIDTMRGNSDSQRIVMYWGAIATPSLSNGPAVFDTCSGFQGVWHLSETGNSIARDATGNRYDGVPSDTAPAGAEGAIGPCRSFNGSSNGIRMNGTADSKLNFQENGSYTISAWAYADTLDIGYHMIAGKNNEQYFLGLKRSNPDTTMRWEFVEYHEKTGWQIAQDFPSAKTWTYLVGVRKGATQYLYVNGVLADSTIEVTPPIAPRNTGDDVTIGRFLSVSAYAKEGKCPFLGKIDEVRISNAACGADWIKLCYMNQKTQDALIVFK